MAYRKLTEKGKEFIRNRCLANGSYGESKFTGKRNFPLPKSTVSPDTVYYAKPINEQNEIITTHEELAKNLISWFERFSEQYALDANIIAAQSYVESEYYVWIYSQGGAMGINQFIDTAIYDAIIKNKYTFEEELKNILNGLEGINPNANKHDIRYIIPNYVSLDNNIISTPDTTQIAKKNREVLFQNIIDNPKLMIKAQCFIMNYIGNRNNNLASSSLFAYNRGSSLKSTSYDDLINKTAKLKGKEYLKQGLEYVDKIFRILAGNEPTLPKGLGFGYQIDFTEADLRTFNMGSYLKISGTFPLSQSQEGKIVSLHPIAQDIFREFIFTIEKETPFNVIITSGYRSFMEQERIRLENKSYTPPRAAATPGNSFHNYGLAIDFILQSKTNENLTYGFNRTKQEWESTRVPSIGKRLGLRWGGDFIGTSYDPVHFDLGNKFNINDIKKIAENTFGTNPNNIRGNQIPLVA